MAGVTFNEYEYFIQSLTRIDFSVSQQIVCSSPIGELTLPSDSSDVILLNGYRDSNGNFGFGGDPISMAFTKLIPPVNDDQTQSCLTGLYVEGSATIQLSQANCNANYGVICRAYLDSAPVCNPNAPFQKQSPISLLLDSKLQSTKQQSVAQKKASYRNMFNRLDQTGSFTALFSTLWYAGLPCFDTKGMTGAKDGEKSILRYCEWKGKQIPCAAIFTKFPTDQGMCCSFNIDAANEIFNGDTYPALVKKLQDTDKNISFGSSTPPNYYVDNGEPTTLPGKNKGLVLMLDAHTDLMAAGSVGTDFKEFTGLVGPPGSFPFTMQESFQIRPGYNNIIALSGSRIDADEDLRDLSIDQRNCSFSNENSNMKLYKIYSYSNCMFECVLLYARETLKANNDASHACIPWFFPSAEASITVCDPWKSVDFFNLMLNDIPDDTCSHCLPDCNNMIYDTSVTTVQFRRCDSSNVGVSKFCTLDNGKLPSPKKFGQQIINEFSSSAKPPTFVKSMESNIRRYDKTVAEGDIFTTNPTTYDAYSEDIAMVQIYFKKSTIFQMGSQPSMTWVDYFSAVGGLMGLVLGMGIVSVIELVWLCLRIISKKAGLTKWII